MKLFKSTLIFFLLIFLLISCQSVKDTLSMKKKKSYDEFLIEKKNPLTLPPNFSKLPKPKDKEEKEAEENLDIDLSTVLENTGENKSINQNSDLEKKLSEILNKNEAN